MTHSRLAPSARFVFRSSEVRSALTQANLETEFFKELRLPNGTYKTTAPNRLASVDLAFLDVIDQGQRLELLDVAVSSGVTTLDWLNSLTKAGVSAVITATDLCIFASLIRRAGVDLLVDGDGRLLQVGVGDYGICRPYRSQVRRIPRIAELLFATCERLSQWLPCNNADRLPLATAAVRGSSIALVETDISQPTPDHWKGRFDGIRAANILHRSYFTDQDIRQLGGNLVECLRPFGMFMVGRTSETGENHFSLLRKGADGSLRVVGRVGRGADIEPLFDATAISV